jgi:UDP-N-acetyl-2-amino-2-deoxyglucuronate dehydrogenase
MLPDFAGTTKRPTFALLGAAGYIAPKHIDAIQSVNGRLLAASDPHDSVGVLDRYGEDVHYFPHIEHFDRWLDKQNRSSDPVDYVVVATPNHLHDAHCRLALRSGSDVILEKPATLCERNLTALQLVEEETGNRVHCILQLRDSPGVQTIRSKATGNQHRGTITYHVQRGPWYDYSWKGDVSRSGGIITNIGVHLFDILTWIYGNPVQKPKSFGSDRHKGGVLWLERGTFDWDIAVGTDMPTRHFSIDRHTVEISDQMGDLHQVAYRKILSNEGWGLQDARPGVALCEALR